MEAIYFLGIGSFFYLILIGITSGAFLKLSEGKLQALVSEESNQSAFASYVLESRERWRLRLFFARVFSIFVLAAFTWHMLPMWKLPGAVILQALLASLVYVVLMELMGSWTASLSTKVNLRLLRGGGWLSAPFSVLALPLEKLREYFYERRGDNSTEPEGALELEALTLIDQAEETGAIEEDRAELLRSVIEFKDLVSKEVMVPRTKTVALDITTSLEDVFKIVEEQGHSRYPVFRNKIDQVEGVLHAKDLFRVLRSRSLRPPAPGMHSSKSPSVDTLASLIRRPVLLATETQPAESLLREMQQKRQHIAVVVDEFGGMSGIVTLEDLLEQIVGDIHDEHDTDEALIQTVVEGKEYIADAAILLDKLEEHTEQSVAKEAYPEGEYASLGGLILELAGKLPAVGDTYAFSQFLFEVLERNDKKIIKVSIKIVDSPEPV